MRWFLRMSRWVRNPPSPRMALMIVAVIVASLAIAGLEKAGWWPDWATSDKIRRVRVVK